MKKCIIFLLFSFSLLFAHPHVFIDGFVKPEFENKNLKGFWVKWVFDEMFTMILIEDYDDNPDGKLDEQELKTICVESSQNLIDYNFYCDLKINGKNQNVHQVKNFTAKIIDNKMEFNLFIPCNIDKGKVEFSLYDKTYYSFFDTLKKQKTNKNFPVKVVAKKKLKTTDYYGDVEALVYTIEL